SWSPARRRNVRASSLSSRADVPASIDNCAQRVRSIRQSSRLIPTCAYVRSNNRWIWLKSVSFTDKAVSWRRQSCLRCSEFRLQAVALAHRSGARVNAELQTEPRSPTVPMPSAKTECVAIASRSQRKRRTRVFVQVQQLIGKLVQREPDFSESIGQ